MIYFVSLLSPNGNLNNSVLAIVPCLLVPCNELINISVCYSQQGFVIFLFCLFQNPNKVCHQFSRLLQVHFLGVCVFVYDCVHRCV